MCIEISEKMGFMNTLHVQLPTQGGRTTTVIFFFGVVQTIAITFIANFVCFSPNVDKMRTKEAHGDRDI